MQAIWQLLSNIGVRSNHSFTEVKNIRLLNQLCLVILPFLPVFFVADIYAADYFGVRVTIGVFFWLGTVLLMQWLGWFRTARHFFVVVLCLTATALILLYGEKLGGEYAYLGLLVTILILYTRRLEQLGMILFVVACFGFSQVMMRHIEPRFDSVVSEYSRQTYFMATMACIFLLTRAFVRANLFYEAKTQQLLNSVSLQHDNLAEQQAHIKAQNKRLEQVNQELEKFAYIASHDLKTPLRNINSFLTLTDRKLKELGQQDEDISEYLGFATRSARQMYFLVEDILEFSRVNAGKTLLERVDLGAILERVTFGMSALIEEKHVSILQDPLPVIRGNDAQFMLMFQNLIENGIKYNESDQPVIRIGYQQVDERLVLRFEDNGIGMDMQYGDKIFEMFARLHSVGEYLGSGIGLAICRKVVEQYEGEIWVESTEGLGSVFFVALPASVLLEDVQDLEKA